MVVKLLSYAALLMIIPSSKLWPFFQTASTAAVSFRATLRRAISGRIPPATSFFEVLFVDSATAGMRGTLEHALESPVVILIQSPRLYLDLAAAHSTIRQLMIGTASGLYRQPKIRVVLRVCFHWC
jgi:hypothetical protein